MVTLSSVPVLEVSVAPDKIPFTSVPFSVVPPPTLSVALLVSVVPEPMVRFALPVKEELPFSVRLPPVIDRCALDVSVFTVWLPEERVTVSPGATIETALVASGS